MKSRSTAILISQFLGMFGMHWFYLGKPEKGVKYFMFFWTLVPAFLNVRDWFQLLGMSDDEFNKLYN